jgi:subtilase family serine protease
LSKVLAFTLMLLLVFAPAPTVIAVHAHNDHQINLTKTTPPKPLGPVESGQILSVSLVLRGQDPEGLQRLLALISTPNSPYYHDYLTSVEIAHRFGVSDQNKWRIDAALLAGGLPAPTYSKDGLLAGLQVTAGQAETFFDVRLRRYRATGGRIYYAPENPPVLPSGFAGAVAGVLGLDQRITLGSQVEFAPHSAEASGVSGLGPADIERAYDLGPLHQDGLDGYNQTIALAEVSTFNQSDIQAYDRQYNILAPPVQVIPVAGGATTNDPESTLDIDLVHAIAPHAQIDVYESPNDLLSVAEMVSQIVSDDQAQVLNISLGTCEAELNASIANVFLTSLGDSFRRADAEGMTILVASGDAGAYDCQDSQLSVNAVAASPFVTSVGGTTLFLHANGTFDYEAGWEGPLEEVGGGGGLSVLYQSPSWQTGPGVENVYSNGMREVPDVSADADPLTGYAAYYTGDGCSSLSQCWQIVGGTSAATPLWASLVLLMNQLAEQRGQRPLGFLDQALYQLEAGSGSRVTAPLPFHDVTIGGNLYYDATPGWDYSTGWGSPDSAVLAQDLLNVRLS